MMVEELNTEERKKFRDFAEMHAQVSKDTFDVNLDFSERSIEEIDKVITNFHPEYNAKWTPKNIPALIIGSENDVLTPIELFCSDKRFDRENIRISTIPNAGHFPWMEQPALIEKQINPINDKINEYQNQATALQTLLKHIKKD